MFVTFISDPLLMGKKGCFNIQNRDESWKKLSVTYIIDLYI